VLGLTNNVEVNAPLPFPHKSYNRYSVPDGVAEADALAGALPDALAGALPAALAVTSDAERQIAKGGGSSGSGSGTGNPDTTAVLAATDAGQQQDRQHEGLGLGEELTRSRACYACKGRFRKVHRFYDRLCPACAHLNYSKRNQVADLSSRTILITGARVKIG
jgi:hypothetical protein